MTPELESPATLVASSRDARIAEQVRGGYKYYALTLLFLVYTLAFVDRQIIVILGESIKADLGIGDAQLGALTGFAFALFYVTLGLPVARLADRYHRVSILSASMAIWSAMTALCGFAGNFWQLAMARFGVGIGEAGCSPPAYSLIADYFPKEQRSTALAIYASGGTALGTFIGFAIGGFVAVSFGWRTAFLLVGIPGVLFAILLRFILKEPEREGYRRQDDRPPGLRETVSALLKSRTFVLVSCAVACNAFVLFAVLNWMPNVLIRVHGVSPADVGLQLGLLFGLGMSIGGLSVGWVTDRLARRDRRYYVWVPAAGVAATPPLLMAAMMADSAAACLALAAVPCLLINCTAGPVLTVIMGLVENRARAFASSMFLLIASVAGVGLSPMLVGLLSDILEPAHGVRSISLALGAAVWLNLASAAFFVLAARSLRDDMSKFG